METRAKRRKMSAMHATSFEDMPDEIILKILAFLSIYWKVRCLRVSKRLRRISSDASLWHTISLNGHFGGHSYMPVPVSFINHFLRNGCKNLQMMNLELVKNVTWAKNNQLKLLDLDKVVGNEEEHKLFSLQDWDQFIKSCKSLQIFSLDIARPGLNSFTNFSQAPIIQRICLQNKETLQVLKLALPSISFKSIRTIVDHCVELKDFSISIYDNIRQPLSCEQLTYLVENLTPNIEKISLRKTGRNLNEKHLKTLVTRFEKNTEGLDLRESGATWESFIAVSKACGQFEKDQFDKLKKQGYILKGLIW